MTLVLTALCLIGAGAFAALLLARWPARAAAASALLTVAGSVLGLVVALDVLLSGDAVSLSARWPVPLGSFSVGIDSLSAVFLVLIFIISPVAAVFGAGYMRGASGRQAAVAWPMLGVFIGSMVLVVIARNGVLFLASWELMAVSSFFLVTLNDRGVEVRNGGKTYLIASHLSAAFLLVFFLMLDPGSGQAGLFSPGALDFDRLPPVADAARAGAMFVLAFIGFGTKAGLMPFHVWLPEADPAAPSHVAAIMSAVAIKMGVYGLLRAISILGSPEQWWGWTLIGAGLVSAVTGALLAFSQNDLKRLLAYSTVENAGLIAMGIGAGLLGQASGSTALVVMGYGAALIHAGNHALFKSLMFMASGVVERSTGVRDMDRLGGLLKLMPVTGAAVAVGALAASGMPPFNGFMGEFLLFRGGLHGGAGSDSGDTALALLVAGGIGLAGALVAATYLKAFGVSFLGAPRSPAAAGAADQPALIWAPLWLLALLTFAAACAAPVLLARLVAPMTVITGWAEAGPAGAAALAAAVAPVRDSMWEVVTVFAALTVAAALLAVVRLMLLRRRTVGAAVTWDCGYARPAPSMQYTSSSFAEPVASVLEPLVRRVRVSRPQGLFPVSASIETSTGDPAREAVYRAAAGRIDRSLLRLRWLQHGRLNLYVLYIAATLVALLIWKVGFS
jgi:formate hydrogenlyase subunit 3/multisubunit Na+/H+ antiporter MnhD subunit